MSIPSVQTSGLQISNQQTPGILGEWADAMAGPENRQDESGLPHDTQEQGSYPGLRGSWLQGPQTAWLPLARMGQSEHQ